MPTGHSRAFNCENQKTPALSCRGLLRCLEWQVVEWSLRKARLAPDQLHPLVAPQVSHFSQVPLRTIVKFWHSEQLLPV